MHAFLIDIVFYLNLRIKKIDRLAIVSSHPFMNQRRSFIYICDFQGSFRAGAGSDKPPGRAHQVCLCSKHQMVILLFHISCYVRSLKIIIFIHCVILVLVFVYCLVCVARGSPHKLFGDIRY